MRISGIVSKVVPSKGTFKTDDGRSIDYDHDLVTVLVDKLDPVDVKVKRAQADAIAGGLPQRGQHIELEVAVPKGTRLDFVSVAQPVKG